MIKKLLLSTIITNQGTDVRNEIHNPTVEEYGLAARAKQKLPPLVVYDTPQGMLLADGFHRFFGFEQQGITHYECDVRKGSRADAIKFALGCNTTHGLRRSNADKRNAVVIALREFPKMSDRSIAEMCKVSNMLVAEIKAEIAAKTEREKLAAGESSFTSNPASGSDSTPEKSVTGKDGKTYKVPPRPTNAIPEPPKKQKALDATGIEVPEEIIPYWDTTFAEASRLLNFVSEIRTRLKRAEDTHEPAFREVDTMDSIAKLDQVYADLKRAKPYAVCPSCNGTATKGCETCHGRGFVSEFYWSKCVPAETKAITGRQ